MALTSQNIGKNKVAEFPASIATFLQLEHPKEYTGHAFRRTGATLLADSGGSVIDLQRAGGWSSAAVASGYVDESKVQSEAIAARIAGTQAPVAAAAASAPATSNAIVTSTSVQRGPGGGSTTYNFSMNLKLDMSKSSQSIVNIFVPTRAPRFDHEASQE